MSILRKLASGALLTAGVFVLFLSANWYSGGGGLYPPLWWSGIADLGVLSLLVASRMVLTSHKDTRPSVSGPNLGQIDPNGSRRAVTVSVLGAILALSALFIPFPVGCNFASSCAMNPEGTWSTIWPNMLTLNLGFVMFAWGLGVSRSRRLSMPGLGIGMVPGGITLLILGLRIGYTTMCPANGCPPLTASAWWSLFWPDVIAGSLGVLLIVLGSLLVLLRWPKRDGGAPGGSLEPGGSMLTPMST
jgi:hypothetical protein